MKIQKILFPTDFSQVAKGAFVYALHLAEKLGASITVINIYRADFGVPVPEVMAYDMLEARKKHAETMLQSFIKGSSALEEALLAKVQVQTQIEMGLAVDAILDVAEQGGFDLIAMGTKGEHNLAETVFGSITSNVLKSAKVPVLAVPSGCTFGNGIERIAFATDLSAASLECGSKLIALTESLQAALHCVHVNTHIGNDTLEMSPLEELKQIKNVEVHQIADSSVSHGLEVFVRENNIQLLVLLHQRRSWWESLFHSSQTKKIALSSNLPLLIFNE
jgi:nucleotide-binding universal stress UspA family protein